MNLLKIFCIFIFIGLFYTTAMANENIKALFTCQSLRYSTSYGLDLIINEEEGQLVADIRYLITLGSQEIWSTEISFDEPTHSFNGKNYSLSVDSQTKDGGFSGQLLVSKGLSRFNGTVICHNSDN